MGEILPHPPMRDRVSLANDRVRLIGETAPVVKGALDKRTVPLPKAIDVLPRPGGVEGELVGRSPNHGSVFLVEAENRVRLAAAQEPVRVQDVAPGGQRGSREPIQGVSNVSPDGDGAQEAQKLPILVKR